MTLEDARTTAKKNDFLVVGDERHYPMPSLLVESSWALSNPARRVLPPSAPALEGLRGPDGWRQRRKIPKGNTIILDAYYIRIANSAPAT